LRDISQPPERFGSNGCTRLLLIVLLALATGQAERPTTIEGAQPSPQWLHERETFIRRQSERFRPLHPHLPVAYRLDESFVAAAKLRRSIEVVDDCGPALCGVASPELPAAWDLADMRAMFTPAGAGRRQRDAFAVALLGRFEGEDPDRWAADELRAGFMRRFADMDDDDRVVVPVTASLIRFLDPRHELAFERMSERLRLLTSAEEATWLTHLRVVVVQPARVPAGRIRGATFSLVNRIERSTISDASGAELQRLHTIGFDAIALMPFAMQRGVHASELRRLAGSPASETDLSMAIAAVRAHRLGMRVLLKPQIWEGSSGDPTQIEPDDWPAWFAAYRRFLMHEALLARAIGAEWLSVGVELSRTESRPEWRALIAEIRGVYHGGLIYAANFDAFEKTPLWPLVDAIGVEYGKPVILTELGYASNGAPWIEPWNEYWRPDTLVCPNEDRQECVSSRQARAYEAMLGALSASRSVAGFFIWKYQSDGGERDGEGFFPKGKPAETVIRKALH
jgi:hypothetical protein